jgi:hypothetical protein
MTTRVSPSITWTARAGYATLGMNWLLPVLAFGPSPIGMVQPAHNRKAIARKARMRVGSNRDIFLVLEVICEKTGASTSLPGKDRNDFVLRL